MILVQYIFPDDLQFSSFLVEFPLGRKVPDGSLVFLEFFFNLLPVLDHPDFKLVVIDDEVEGDEEDGEKEEWKEVRPDVDAFVVQHEQAFEELSFGVEVDAIARVYLIVVFEVVGG